MNFEKLNKKFLKRREFNGITPHVKRLSVFTNNIILRLNESFNREISNLSA